MSGVVSILHIVFSACLIFYIFITFIGCILCFSRHLPLLNFIFKLSRVSNKILFSYIFEDPIFVLF